MDYMERTSPSQSWPEDGMNVCVGSEAPHGLMVAPFPPRPDLSWTTSGSIPGRPYLII